MRATRTQTRAQGMTEYVLVVGLIAVLLIVPVKMFGWRLEESFFAASIELLISTDTN